MADEAEELADCSFSGKQEQKQPVFLEEANQPLVHAQKGKDKVLRIDENKINTMTHASV